MMKPLFLSVYIAFLAASCAYSQDRTQASDSTGESIVKALDSETRELAEAYRNKLEALDSAYIAKVKTLQGEAAAGLSELQKKVATENLDEAVRLRDLALEIGGRTITLPLRSDANSKGSSKREDDDTLLKVKQKELLTRISELEKQLGLQSELSKKIAGTSYRIKFGKDTRVWTFAPNGVLLNNGNVTATRWSAFGNDGIICAGYDNGNIDICQFSKDFRNIEVIFIGDFKMSRIHHMGTLETR